MSEETKDFVPCVVCGKPMPVHRHMKSMCDICRTKVLVDLPKVEVSSLYGEMDSNK